MRISSKMLILLVSLAGASIFTNTMALALENKLLLNANKTMEIIAHRGGRKSTPENTLAAFKNAIACGVDGIELDIHRCKSGELVVIHDETVDRTSNGHGFVKDMDLAELKKLDAGSWFAAKFKDERFPTLSEVLQLIDGKLVLNIEIKNTPLEYPGIENDLLKELVNYKHKDKVIISSFDHKILKLINKKDPSLKIAFLDDALPYDIASYAKKLGAEFWHPHFGQIRPDVMEESKNSAIKVNVWTVNDPKDWLYMIKMGVNGIITDDPLGLKEYLHKLDK